LEVWAAPSDGWAAHAIDQSLLNFDENLLDSGRFSAFFAPCDEMNRFEFSFRAALAQIISHAGFRRGHTVASNYRPSSALNSPACRSGFWLAY
jgi:hypothetical protein